jgi:hypothetical protein
MSQTLLREDRMLKTLLPEIAMLLLSCAFLAPRSADAQDCGHDCVTCIAGTGYEGVHYEKGGAYDMTCTVLVQYCVACAPQLPGDTTENWPVNPDTRVSDAAPGAEAIVQLIQSTPPSRLKPWLGKFHNRILLVPDRNLVVVKGNGCDPEALTTVLFVSPEKVKKLGDLGVLTLREYLRNRRSQ